MSKIKDLKNLMQFVGSYGAIGVIVKVGMVALLSVAASQVETFQSAWTLLIGVSVGIYALMEYFGFKFYQKFPESLVECVESEVHSDTFKKNYV